MNRTAFVLAPFSRPSAIRDLRNVSRKGRSLRRAAAASVPKRARCKPVASASAPPPTEGHSSAEAVPAPKETPAPFTGHTLAEAGESRWAPWWLLVAFRTLFALALVSSTLIFLWVGEDFPVPIHVYTMLTIVFWGPMVQAVGFVLLSACSLRGRKLAAAGSTGEQRLANIAVPVYQTGSVLGLVYLAMLGDWVVGLTVPIFFLVDTLLLRSKVRFRFVYNWIPLAVFVVYLAVFCGLWVFNYGAEYLGVGVMALVLSIFAVLSVGGGAIFTQLTRITSK